MPNTPIKAHIEDTIPKPVAEVFNAVIDARKLYQFFVSGASGNLVEGSTVSWDFGKYGKVDVVVKQIVANTIVVFEWAASGTNCTVEMIFESMGPHETAIKIIESGWPMDEEGVKKALGQTQGWTGFIDGLKAYLLFNINLREGRLVGPQ